MIVKTNKELENVTVITNKQHLEILSRFGLNSVITKDVKFVSNVATMSKGNAKARAIDNYIPLGLPDRIFSLQLKKEREKKSKKELER